MRHLNTRHFLKSEALSKEVHNTLVREEDSYSDINTGHFLSGHSAQAFIVEWQMQPNDTNESKKRTLNVTEPGIYLH